VGDDGVHSDRVLIAEGLAHGVDGGQPDIGGIQRVDSQMGRAPRVGGAADITDGLDDATVVGGGHPRLLHLGLRRGVDHHGEIHVVEVAEPQQLRLAAEELEPALARLLDAPLHVAVLLSGHGEEDHSPGEVSQGLGIEEAHGGTEQPRHLGIVAAGMSGAALRVRHRMPGHHEPVQLAEQREGGPFLGAARLRADAGDGETGLGRQAEPSQGFLHQTRRLELLEAELRVAPDGLAQPDDRVGAAVDGLADLVLEPDGVGHDGSFLVMGAKR
jgi:hypothetical protein